MSQSVKRWARPLVVGAGGQLGVELCRALDENGSENIVRSGRGSGPDSLTLDLGQLLTPDDAANALGPVSPDLILCAGAMTFVDGCEDQPEQAAKVNTTGPAALAAYAHSRGVPFVFFSSDYVFPGSPEHPGPYAEDAVPDPLSVYGRTKLQGERAVLRVHPEALAVRTSWVYGPDAAGKNFISYLLRQLRAGERVRVPLDQVSTPTYNRDLAQVTLALVAAQSSGVVHATGPDLMSRLELAQAVARFFNLDEALIEGVTTESLGQRARRPLRSGLLCQRLEELGPQGRMRPFQEGLRETAASLRT